MSSSKALTIIQQPTIGLVPHLSSFTIFSECFWVLYVSTSCLPRMFSSIDSSKRESVCGKAWWYGRDVPKVEILIQSQRPITFCKDHRRPLQIFGAIMSLCLVCCGCLTLSIHQSRRLTTLVNGKNFVV